jgi:hypothetical protein
MTTDAWRRAGGVAAVLALVASAAHAHDVSLKPVRELLRIQGYRMPAPAGVTPLRELKMTVLGRAIPLAVIEWRTFVFRDANPDKRPNEPTGVVLQGERPMLSRITSAKPEQQITILAERRPGSSDVFVLTVDLCPAK